MAGSEEDGGKMKRWVLSAKVSGDATAIVEAETEAEALEMASQADWKLDDWDLNTGAHRGGYLDAMEAE